MSLWFRRKDKQGRVHWYGVEILPTVLMMLLVLAAIAVALLLPLWQRLRVLF